MSKVLIQRVDYQQIFRTIYSVLTHEKADLKRSCLLFNVTGAVLLNECYGIDARPVAGTSAYCVSSEPLSTLLFSSEKDGQLIPSDDGFHCWIETRDWVVDFTAPLFPLIVEQAGLPDPGPKMMQQKIEAAKTSPDELTKAGDFFFCPDQDFTTKTLRRFAEIPLHQDVIEICRRWYARPPKQIKREITLANQRGEMAAVHFSRYQVIGSW